MVATVESMACCAVITSLSSDPSVGWLLQVATKGETQFAAPSNPFKVTASAAMELPSKFARLSSMTSFACSAHVELIENTISVAEPETEGVKSSSEL
jgi:hypothetical protein